MSKFKPLCLAVLAGTVPASAMADFSGYVGLGFGGSRVERDDVSLTVEEYTTSGLAFLYDPPYNVSPYRATLDEFSDPEGTDFSFKLFGGVRYGRYLGAEVGYLNLGEAADGFSTQIPAIVSSTQGSPIDPEGPACTPIQPEPNNCNEFGIRPLQDRQIDVETKIDGFQGYLVGFLPLGESFELFAKLGLIRWDMETRVIDRIGSVVPVNQPGVPELLVSGTVGDSALAEPVAGSGQTFMSERFSESGTDLAAGAGVQIKASERVSLRAELEWFDIEGTSLTWTGNVGLVFGF